MSSNFSDNTNRFTSGAIILSLNQSVPPRPDFRGNRFVVAQSIPSAGPYNLSGDTLPPHAGPPFDHQIFTPAYESQPSLVQNFRTDMDLGSNRQQLHVAMRGDVNQQIPGSIFSSFQTNSALVPSANMRTMHEIGERSLAAVYHLRSGYGVGDSHICTSTYNSQPQPLVFNDIFMNNAPSYYSCNSEVSSIQQSPTMAGSISDSESANLTLTPDSGVFMNNVHPSWKSPLMTQQTPYHAHDVQADHPGNLAVGIIQQSPTMAVDIPTSADYYQVRLAENTNNTNADGKESCTHSLVADGDTVYWGCNFSGCQYVSRFKRDMKRHCSKLGHGGRREHKCKVCRTAFVRQDTLKRHMRETRCWLRQIHKEMIKPLTIVNGK